MTTGNVDASYAFPAIESGMVHVSMDVLLPFDAATGQRHSNPFVQKFWPQEYLTAETTGGFAGYTRRMLHKPQELERLEVLEAKKKQQ